MSFRLVPTPFETLPGWSEDNSHEAARALAKCARHARLKPYNAGSLDIRSEDFAPAYAALDEDAMADPASARRYFESHFRAARIVPAEGASGFVTGFYEPEVAVREHRDETFRYPFYRRPDDLIDITEQEAPALYGQGFRFGRRVGGSVAAYADRTAIEQGALAGRNLEIAWAASRIDVFFAHIQGCARLVFADGRVRRITFAAKSGHPFTAIGRVLIDKGELSAAEVTMASLRAWLAANPERQDEIFWRNQSFIFFKEDAPREGEGDGPIAAAKVPLTPGRSLAVDKATHTFSTPFYVEAPRLLHLDGNAPFRRLMIAQDTGSAILGPARGDIFTGSGAAAGDLAGCIKHKAVFHILLPLPAAERLL